MKFFEWLKNLFTRKNKKLLLTSGNEENKQQAVNNIENINNTQINDVENIEQQNKLTQEEKKKQRLETPYFSYKFTVLDGITNRQFQGVDLSTGEILRLQNTDKIAEAPNGMCIYEGFVEHSDDDKEAYIFDKETTEGYPVIFESAIKLEDIASNKDPKQINAVLKLLSKNKEVKLLKDQLIYIGGIRQDGKVYRQDCSSEQVAETITQKMIQYRWN